MENEGGIMKTGLVDVGGGMRDIYGAGVLDYCLDQGIGFDCCIGVSAGSANVTSFLAGQKGRNYRFYTEYAFRKEYMGFENWLKKRNYVDLDYIYGTLSNSDGEYPLDYEQMCAGGEELLIVAANALTGKPHYFRKQDLKQDCYDPVKASSCVPMVNSPYFINGIPYYDGGIADPIPVDKCLEEGCDQVVLILTRPKEYRRSPDRDRLAVRHLKHRYPLAAQAMMKRAETYNRELDHAAELERQGKVLIIAPDDIGKMKTLTKDLETIKALYRKGYEDGSKIMPYVRRSEDSAPER